MWVGSGTTPRSATRSPTTTCSSTTSAQAASIIPWRPGVFTWDSYFSSVENLNYVHAKPDRFGQPRGYVGDLKMNRRIWYRGKENKAEALGGTIAPEDRKELRRGDKRQWYFTCTIHIPKVDHKVRILILW